MKKRRNKYGAESTVASDSYLTPSVSLTWLFIVRLALLCVVTASAAVLVAQFYALPINLLHIALYGAGFAALFYALYSYFNKWLVSGGLLIAAGVVIYIYRTRLINSFSYFSDWILKSLDSRLLKTEILMTHKSFAIFEGSANVQNSCMIYMVILTALLALLFTSACRTRFRLMTVLSTVILMLIPCFAAEKAGFEWSVVPFLASAIGMEAVWSSYELEAYYIFWGHRKAYYALQREESLYNKKTSRFSPARKIRSDLPRYSKYTGNAIATTIIVGGLLTASALLFKDNSAIDYDKIYQNINDMYMSAVNSFENTFSLNLGGSDDNGYFSDTSSSEISNRISIGSPGTSSLPVLTVTLDSNQSPVFLRGDIGIDFAGDQWTTFGELDYSPDAETSEMLANYYPETDFQVFRQKLMFQGYMPDDYIGFQKVKIEYLRSTKVALMPVAPYELNYKTSDILDCTGDFVLRLKNSDGVLKTFESLTLYPVVNKIDFADALALTSEYDYSAMEWTLPNGLTMEEYNRYKALYSQYVKNVYLDINTDEYENISYLLNEIGSISDGRLITDLNPDNTSDRYNAAKAVCDYFHNNYTYSLSTDNTSKDFTTIGTFIRNTKSGHCALYATAMTLAMRQLGIPARYVTGYVVQGEGTPANGSYEYTLRDRNLHAWVEVYFPEVGWLPFDPTASDTSNYEVVSTQTSVVTTSTEPVQTETSVTTTTRPVSSEETEISRTQTVTEAEKASLSRETIFAIVICGAFVLLIVMIIVWLIMLKKTERKFFAEIKSTPEKKMAVLFTFTLRLLRAFGIEQMKGELPEAFAMRTDMKFPVEIGSMSECMRIFEKAEFSGEAMTREECAYAAEYAEQLYKATVLKANPFKRIICRAALFK